MSTIAGINLVQGRIATMQSRLTTFLGEGPAGAGLTASRPTGTASFADVAARLGADPAGPTATASSGAGS